MRRHILLIIEEVCVEAVLSLTQEAGRGCLEMLVCRPSELGFALEDKIQYIDLLRAGCEKSRWVCVSVCISSE